MQINIEIYNIFLFQLWETMFIYLFTNTETHIRYDIIVFFAFILSKSLSV